MTARESATWLAVLDQEEAMLLQQHKIQSGEAGLTGNPDGSAAASGLHGMNGINGLNGINGINGVNGIRHNGSLSDLPFAAMHVSSSSNGRAASAAPPAAHAANDDDPNEYAPDGFTTINGFTFLAGKWPTGTQVN